MPNHIGGNYGPNPYGNYGQIQGPQPGGYAGPGQVGGFNPYQMMSFFTNMLRTLAQLQSGWQGYMNPHPRPAPFPGYGGVRPPADPPMQALYGVAIGPRPTPHPEPPMQALYGVAIGPRPIPNPEPPMQALYGVAIGPGRGQEPPIQALYGVALN